MHNKIIIVTLLTLALLLGCGEPEEIERVNPIVGKWEYIHNSVCTIYNLNSTQVVPTGSRNGIGGIAMIGTLSDTAEVFHCTAYGNTKSFYLSASREEFPSLVLFMFWITISSEDSTGYGHISDIWYSPTDEGFLYEYSTEKVNCHYDSLTYTLTLDSTLFTVESGLAPIGFTDSLWMFGSLTSAVDTVSASEPYINCIYREKHFTKVFSLDEAGLFTRFRGTSTWADTATGTWSSTSDSLTLEFSEGMTNTFDHGTFSYEIDGSSLNFIIENTVTTEENELRNIERSMQYLPHSLDSRVFSDEWNYERLE